MLLVLGSGRVRPGLGLIKSLEAGEFIHQLPFSLAGLRGLTRQPFWSASYKS